MTLPNYGFCQCGAFGHLYTQDCSDIQTCIGCLQNNAIDLELLEKKVFHLTESGRFIYDYCGSMQEPKLSEHDKCYLDYISTVHGGYDMYHCAIHDVRVYIRSDD